MATKAGFEKLAFEFGGVHWFSVVGFEGVDSFAHEMHEGKTRFIGADGAECGVMAAVQLEFEKLLDDVGGHGYVRVIEGSSDLAIAAELDALDQRRKLDVAVGIDQASTADESPFGVGGKLRD